ncbi:putative acyl-CoA desaturase [Helianthus annuus]|nr:putative acyl-CoA desaturase [Helianthus annuus]
MYSWWEIDFTWWCILFLEAIGLATNVKLPTKAHKVKRSFTSSNSSDSIPFVITISRIWIHALLVWMHLS